MSDAKLTCKACGYDSSAQAIILSRVSGALCDAATVIVDPYDEGIRELTEERDAYRSTLADLVAFWKATYPMSTGFTPYRKAVSILKHGIIRPAVPEQSTGGREE